MCFYYCTVSCFPIWDASVSFLVCILCTFKQVLNLPQWILPHWSNLKCNKNFSISFGQKLTEVLPTKSESTDFIEDTRTAIPGQRSNSSTCWKENSPGRKNKRKLTEKYHYSTVTVSLYWKTVRIIPTMPMLIIKKNTDTFIQPSSFLLPSNLAFLWCENNQLMYI